MIRFLINNDVVEMISQQRQRIMELKERRGEEYILDDDFEKILDFNKISRIF